MGRGCLIVFEGIDRVGKSTQAKLLVDRLRSCGHDVEMMNFPDRKTEIGQTINAYLTSTNHSTDSSLEDHSVHLLFSANRWEKMPMMEQKLLKGKILVVDRYAFSGVAFTSAKPGFSIEWCKQSDAGILKPDCVFFLQIEPDCAKSRGDYGLERYEKLEFQRTVLSRYLALQDSSWKCVNADRDVTTIHEDLFTQTQQVIKNYQNSSIARLWVQEE